MAANGHGNENGGGAGGYWKYLITANKTATPQLEDYCLGLTKIIRELEPGPDSELSPQRLAAFYRQTGSNFDSVFLKTDHIGLSFIYRTLGCRHSLQPTSDDFAYPSVPCLSDAGFVRWQTLQLLLYPTDNVRCLQRAVEKWDVPRSDGGYFPQSIPTQCFPALPDPEMERWHQNVLGSMHQELYKMKRLKNSPYQSPHPDTHDRRDNYFPHRGRPVDHEQARLDAMRRRSSVPDVILPLPETKQHRDRDRDRKARSSSAQRPPADIRQRSQTNPLSPPQSKYNHSHTPLSPRHGSNPNHHHPYNRHSSYSQHARPRPSSNIPTSSSTVNDDSGSEASSEASHLEHRSRPRRSDEERQNRRSSLWPPNFFKSHKRRHSSDESPRKIEAKPPLPARPDYYPPKHFKHGAPQPQPVTHAPYPSVPNPGVRFRNDIFMNDVAHSSPESPVYQTYVNGQPHTNGHPPTIRYPEPQPSYPTQQMENMAVGQGQPASRHDSSSSSNDRQYTSDWDRHAQRKAGAPIRVSTVTGVSGRKYPNNPTEMSSGERERQNGSRVRGSLPAMA